MKISYIVPIYKPDYSLLKKCINSLLDQSYKEIEIICVLDGEDDIAETALNAFIGNKVKIVKIAHGGACKARNEGFKVSTGDIICFWDCDCIIECHSAKAWIDIFNKRPEIGFIYSGYKFLDEKGAILSEQFDPWLLKIRNYISTCFPVRRKLVVSWDENLKSLQDWDFWLSVVEKGGKGHFLDGFAFSTAFPTEKSISGINCKDNVWLERLDAVKKKHNLPYSDICISSLNYKHEGIRLAKLLDCHFQINPNFKPHRYKKIIQIGFGLSGERLKAHSSIFQCKNCEKIVFWTSDNIEEIYNCVSLKMLKKYSELLNLTATQYCEDMEAFKILKDAGFNASVVPIPMTNEDIIQPLPEELSFLVDIDGNFSNQMQIIERSCPEIKFIPITGAHEIKDISGLISLNCEGTMTFNIKRMLLAGKHIISNCKNPFCGYINNNKNSEEFMKELLHAIRNTKGNRDTAVNYYKKLFSPEKLRGILNENIICNTVI